MKKLQKKIEVWVILTITKPKKQKDDKQNQREHKEQQVKEGI
uniref:Uncharacterized protein n=1 Tax=Vibrio genomosp. F6 TaxID=723172 RepID=A0A0H3ZTD8_9VIBR|nr:hypothetical protein [Vibrio genomosp. F6]